jgi:hypothetical protein
MTIVLNKVVLNKLVMGAGISVSVVSAGSHGLFSRKYPINQPHRQPFRPD